jgi:hypothetical protein
VPEKSSVQDRLKSIREATAGAPTQGAFAAVLQHKAERLFGEEVEHRYAQTLVNRLENGGQPPTLQDIAVYAALDPRNRGKLWLAWGEAVDSSIRRQPLRDLAAQHTAPDSQQEPASRLLKQRTPAQKASAKKKGNAG